MVVRGVLADVEDREVEPDEGDGAHDPGDGPTRGEITPVVEQGAMDDGEVGDELVRVGVGPLALPVLEQPGRGGCQPVEDDLQGSAIGLLRLDPLGQGQQVVAGRDDARRLRHLDLQRLKVALEQAQRGPRLLENDLLGDRRCHERVAVPVAADPRPEPDGHRRGGELHPELAQARCQLVDDLGQHLVGQLLEVEESRPRLLDRPRPVDPQLVGLPQPLDHLGQPALDTRPVAGWARGSARSSRRSAIWRILVSTDRREASVGWAVKTGRTSTCSTVRARSATSRPASRTAFMVSASEAPSCSADSSSRCTCSATLTRWK